MLYLTLITELSISERVLPQSELLPPLDEIHLCQYQEPISMYRIHWGKLAECLVPDQINSFWCAPKNEREHFQEQGLLQFR